MGSTSQTSTKLGPHMYHQGVDLSFPKKWAWQLMSVARADPKNKQKCHKIQKVSTSNKNSFKKATKFQFAIRSSLTIWLSFWSIWGNGHAPHKERGVYYWYIQNKIRISNQQPECAQRPFLRSHELFCAWKFLEKNFFQKTQNKILYPNM